MKEKLEFLGIWTFTRIDNLGNIIDKEIKRNTIVNNGLNLVRDFIGNVGVNAPKYIAIGTDGTGVANGDTELYVEVDRQLADIDVATNYQVKFSKTFTFAGPATILEAGLLDSITTLGSTMFNRVTTSKVVSATINLIVEATITVSRV